MLKSKNKKFLSLALGAVVLFAGTVAAVLMVFNSADGDIVLRSDDAGVIVLGQKVYENNCASCHGEKLQGQPDWKRRNDAGLMPAPPHDKSGHTWHHADALLFDLTKFGLQKVAGADYKSDMPAFTQTLSDREIIAALSYIKSTWPLNIRKKHDEINQAYKQRSTSQ